MTGFIERAKQVNKWKVSFFVMALMFEVAREAAVIEASEAPQPYALGSVHIYGDGDYVSAQGVWTRINAGDPLERIPTSIECRKELGVCIESNVMAFRESVMAPNVSIHQANFTNEAITWSDDFPICVKYDVRIDIKGKKIFAERKKKIIDNEIRSKFTDIDKNCASLEAYIPMEFKKSELEIDDPTQKHFLPIIKLLRMAFSSNEKD